MSAEIKKRRPRKRRWRRFEDTDFQRGSYIIPNLFTTGNIFSGFFGMVSAINSNFEMAAVAILISCVFDILDGKVARLTRATSRFGVEYDSLADVVSFGVGPAILVYLWALRPLGRLGWLAAFVYMACGALRLARFNVQVDTSSKKYFTGLPIPGGAVAIATTVLFFHTWKISLSPFSSSLLLVVTFLLGFLMVSTIPFNSFKDLESMAARPIPVLFGAVLFVTIVAINPGSVLFILMLAYVLSGPIVYLMQRSRQPKADQEPEAAEEAPKELPSEPAARDENTRQ